MKKHALRTASLTLLLAMAVAFTTPAHAQVGIAAGLNFNQLDDISTETVDASYENSTGYHIGVFYDLGLGAFALRPGVFYREVGTYEFSDLTENIDMNTVEVPIDVRLRLLPQSPVKFYLMASPVLTFPQSEQDFESTKSVNLNADVGAGLEIALANFTLMPELRYGIATSSFLEDEFQVGDTEVQPQDDPRLNSVMLRLNIRF